MPSWTSAKPSDKAPEAVARLPTVIELFVTPGAVEVTWVPDVPVDPLPVVVVLEQAAATSPTASADVATTRLPRRCLTLFPLFLPVVGRPVPLKFGGQMRRD